jgi:Flp pilus assembly protein TadD
VSYAALGQVKEAETEQAAFRAATSAIAPDLKLAINHAKDVLAIADHMLDGEIAFRRGDMDRAVSALRQAIEVEDHLGYMEPPEWIQPVRHTLGAFLVHAGRYDANARSSAGAIPAGSSTSSP